MADGSNPQLHQFDSFHFWKEPLLPIPVAQVGGVERNSSKLATARNSKHEVADRVQDFHRQDVPRDGDSRIVAMDFDHCKEVPVVMTDSKGWSYEQPKSEESLEVMKLSDRDLEGEEKLTKENRLRTMRGEGDLNALVRCEEKEQESLFVSRLIIEECVEMAVYGGDGLLEKNGSKGIFDADDDAGRKEACGNEVMMSSPSTREHTRPSPHPRLAAWLLREGASEAQVLPEGRSAVAIYSTGCKKDLNETRDLVLGQAENLVAVEERVMVDQMRLDLVFPNEAVAAGFCVKIELLQLTLPSALSVTRMHVADLGYHLAPVLNEQELLTLAANSAEANLFSTPLLVDMEDPGTGLQARFFSVVDVNLFLHSRGLRDEHRSLGALRELTQSKRLELGPSPAPNGRNFRVKVDRRPPVQLPSFEIVSQGPHGVVHLLFRRKQELFNFLFSSAAKQLSRVQLEDEDILGREAKQVEEVGVRVRVSWELNLQEPSLSPLPHLLKLNRNGLLPIEALLEVTGGRAITGLRYRRLGVRSSEWRSCPREGDMLLPPPGGWSQAADYVVFADRRGAPDGNKVGEGVDYPGGQNRRGEVEDLLLKVKELEKKMVQEAEARAKLEGKVFELEGIIIKMREEATASASRSRSRSPSKEDPFSKSSRFGGFPGGACAGVRTRGGLNSRRCSKETYLDENTLLNYRWQSSADQLPKSVSNFIKKAPIKEVTEKNGSLIFTLNEQDLDFASMELVSHRSAIGGRARVKMVRSSGRFCLFSENKLQAVDFLPYEGEVQGPARNLVFFSTKLLMIETLRDPVIQRKYPSLAISKNCLFEK